MSFSLRAVVGNAKLSEYEKSWGTRKELRQEMGDPG